MSKLIFIITTWSIIIQNLPLEESQNFLKYIVNLKLGRHNKNFKIQKLIRAYVILPQREYPRYGGMSGIRARSAGQNFKTRFFYPSLPL